MSDGVIDDHIDDRDLGSQLNDVDRWCARLVRWWLNKIELQSIDRITQTQTRILKCFNKTKLAQQSFVSRNFQNLFDKTYKSNYEILNLKLFF
jgi:hypothetical protein